MTPLPGTSPQLGVEAMTLRVRGRSVQTPVQTRSSVVLWREPSCETQNVGGQDPRREIDAWLCNRGMNDTMSQEIAVLARRQACNTLFLHKIGDATKISCTF